MLSMAFALTASGCSAPILANPPLVFPSPVPPSGGPSAAPDPIPIAFPRDDGPHDRLTEWWYYTGHLRAQVSQDDLVGLHRFGFEAVVFRAERGTVPPAWAAHLALTDEFGNRFAYAQRSEIGTQVDHSPRDARGAATGFDLQIGGLSPTLVTAGGPASAAPWRLAGAGGTDRIEAALAPEEAQAAGAAFGLNLDLESTKPAALHDGDGFVDFGSGGSSYYYSRTRLAATGTVQVDGQQLSVDGVAWFDHQWGDFVSVGGGWNWFAVNLGDGTDLTISEVFDPRGENGLEYGTVVEPDGAVRHLDAGAFGVTAGNAWASPKTGRLYPTNWFITIPDFRDGRELQISLEPTLDDQELDARPTTGVIYWEGSQHVSATLGLIDATTLDGEAYVELTRYGP